jgi:sphinganine-1-phosphate aldolase
MFESAAAVCDGTSSELEPAPVQAEQLASKQAIVDMFLHAFMHENALNPLVFPSLRQFEVETVAMVADMLHGDSQCVGSVTSGGTESILMAVKTYRDRARKLYPHITNPEIVSHVFSSVAAD